MVVSGNIAGVGVSLANDEEVLYATLTDIKPSLRARVSPAVSRLHTFIHTYIHIYIHTYIHTWSVKTGPINWQVSD